jgi:hypothetical protein
VLGGITVTVDDAGFQPLVSRFADCSGLADCFGQDLIGGLDPGEGR